MVEQRMSLVLLAAVSIATARTLAAQGTQDPAPAWRLDKIATYFNPPPAVNIAVTGLEADGNGGEALVTMDGRAYNLCPGGAEKLLVKWRFDRSVALLRPGDRFTAAFSAVPVSKSAPCGGALLDRTYISIATSGGHTIGWWTDAEKRVIYDATYGISGDRGGAPDWGSSMVIGVRDKTPSRLDGAGQLDPRKHTWFSLWIQNPATTAEIVYLYDLSRPDLPPPSPAPPSEAGTGSAASVRGSSGGAIGCIACDGRYRILLPGANGVLTTNDRNDPVVARAAMPVSARGTLRRLRVQTSAPDAGIWYFTLQVPGKAGGLSCTLDGRRDPGATVCEDRSGELRLEAGDRYFLAIGNPGAPVTSGKFRVEWSADFTPR